LLRGHLNIEAGLRPDGRTILVRQSFQAPFHLSKPYWDGEVLQVRVVNATAGILSGDRLELRIRVAAGASLAVITPAATRAFMMRSGVAECRQEFGVEAGGWLENAPEPLFPHKDTDYSQATRLELAEGAEAYFADVLAPGRAGRGELWAWRRLSLSLAVDCAGEPVLRERLAGSGPELARRAALYGGAEAWFGTVVIFSARRSGLARGPLAARKGPLGRRLAAPPRRVDRPYRGAREPVAAGRPGGAAGDFCGEASASEERFAPGVIRMDRCSRPPRGRCLGSYFRSPASGRPATSENIH